MTRRFASPTRRAAPLAGLLLLLAACGDDTEVQLAFDAGSSRDATVEAQAEGGGSDAADAADTSPEATADTMAPPEDAPPETADAPSDSSEDAADVTTDVGDDSSEAGEEAGEAGGDDAATE